MTRPVPVVRAPRVGAVNRPRLPARPLPRLSTMREAPDPIDESRYTGSPEADAKIELEQVVTGFLARAKAEQERFETATDTGYYTTLVFDSAEQCTAFLRAVGITGDDDDFVDGRAVAHRFGIELPRVEYRGNPSPRIDPRLAALVRKP